MTMYEVTTDRGSTLVDADTNRDAADRFARRLNATQVCPAFAVEGQPQKFGYCAQVPTRRKRLTFTVAETNY